MHAKGEYSISDLAEFFSVSRPIVYPHSTGTLPLSVRSCPLPESTRGLAFSVVTDGLVVGVGRLGGF